MAKYSLSASHQKPQDPPNDLNAHYLQSHFKLESISDRVCNTLACGYSEEFCFTKGINYIIFKRSTKTELLGAASSVV